PYRFPELSIPTEMRQEEFVTVPMRLEVLDVRLTVYNSELDVQSDAAAYIVPVVRSNARSSQCCPEGGVIVDRAVFAPELSYRFTAPVRPNSYKWTLSPATMAMSANSVDPVMKEVRTSIP